MDTSGNIKRFASLQEAEHEGFTTQLTKAQAEELEAMDVVDRQVALRRLRFEAHQGGKLVAALSALAVTGAPELQTSRKQEARGPSAKELAYKRQRRKRNKAARKARKRGRRS